MERKDKFIGILAAAGSGRRLAAGRPKQFLCLAGRPLLAWPAEIMAGLEEIAELIITCPEGREELTRACLGEAARKKPCHIIQGGLSRQESVTLALEQAELKGYGWVVIHDAARPFTQPGLFCQVMAQARSGGAALAAWPSSDTIKEADQEGRVKSTLDRETIWLAQTPQAFALLPLLQALRSRPAGLVYTDEAALWEMSGRALQLVAGPRSNFKITTEDDWNLAQRLSYQPRIGFGFDAHRLVAGRPLIVGGVLIAHPRGLQGHSDADVLTHALMDALLAAASLGDIGAHFPDQAPAYANISSLKLLEMVKSKLTGYEIQQINALIVAQSPKMAPHIPAMRANWAAVLSLAAERINIAATTTEGMGYAGRGEGIAAQAQVLLKEKSSF
jgi:2-C-methyl-D-erythritol 4-phosphate cytidylyltransferase/2-C-methyl-D-erythritol 2,4-cyclodiphosphate synthase